MIKSTYSGRGSGLEEQINTVNELYKAKGLALVQKIPTPITPIEMKGSQITRAFFAQRSTVDYIGVAQGIPICFDAKECKEKRIPFHNFKDHQEEFMRSFEKQEGIAFFLIYFKLLDEYYYLPFRDFEKLKRRSEAGGPKSIAPSDIKDIFKIPNDKIPVHYLEAINKDLELRELERR